MTTIRPKGPSAFISRAYSDDDIIAACESQSAANNGHYRLKCAVFPSSTDPQAFIKFAPDDEGMLEEARNQEFAYNALHKLDQGTPDIRIPEIYRVFSRSGMVYIVMEYVHGQTIKDLLTDDGASDCLAECYSQITRAMQMFLSIDVPVDATPGPVGGGIIKHPIFKNTIASIKYDSVAHLEKHITAVANRQQGQQGQQGQKVSIDFTGEKLCFCFSDLYEGNFIRTSSGELYIVDFEHASFLPTSLMTYALDQPRPICAAIKDDLNLPQKNLKALRGAGYL